MEYKHILYSFCLSQPHCGKSAFHPTNLLILQHHASQGKKLPLESKDALSAGKGGQILPHQVKQTNKNPVTWFPKGLSFIVFTSFGSLGLGATRIKVRESRWDSLLASLQHRLRVDPPEPGMGTCGWQVRWLSGGGGGSCSRYTGWATVLFSCLDSQQLSLQSIWNPD